MFLFDYEYLSKTDFVINLVCSERDNLSQELMEVKKRFSYLDVTYKTIASDRDEVAKEVGLEVRSDQVMV